MLVRSATFLNGPQLLCWQGLCLSFYHTGPAWRRSAGWINRKVPQEGPGHLPLSLQQSWGRFVAKSAQQRLSDSLALRGEGMWQQQGPQRAMERAYA